MQCIHIDRHSVQRVIHLAQMDCAQEWINGSPQSSWEVCGRDDPELKHGHQIWP